MASLSMMTEEEQYRQDEDPDLLKACSMTGSIRWLEIYRGYLLQDRLEKANLEEYEGIITAWGRAMGITPGTLRSHLRWARLIRLEDLLAVFEEESIPSEEWTQRVGTTILRVIARARNLATDWPISSREMAEWARRAYHANLSKAEMEDMLRDHDLLPPKAESELAPPTKLPTTASGLLELITTAVKANDIPLTVTRGGKAKIGPALRKLADLIDKQRPGAEFRIGKEAKL